MKTSFKLFIEPEKGLSIVRPQDCAETLPVGDGDNDWVGVGDTLRVAVGEGDKENVGDGDGVMVCVGVGVTV